MLWRGARLREGAVGFRIPTAGKEVGSRPFHRAQGLWGPQIHWPGGQLADWLAVEGGGLEWGFTQPCPCEQRWKGQEDQNQMEQS